MDKYHIYDKICNCPNCGKEAYIRIEPIYHNEYYIESECPHCGDHRDGMARNIERVEQIKKALNVREREDL